MKLIHVDFRCKFDKIPEAGFLLDLTEDGEEGGLHPVGVDVALPGVLQTEVVHPENLVEDVLDICVSLTTATTTPSPA